MCYQNENLGWGGYLLAITVTVYPLQRIPEEHGYGYMNKEYIRRTCICQVVLKNAKFHRVPSNTVYPATGKPTCGAPVMQENSRLG